VVIVWAPQAIAELKKAYNYISRDSPKNARRVIDEITEMADELATWPEMFPLDKFKRDNDGSWRAFEKFHYRISYRIIADQIRIVRMRHTSRTPRMY
jgi:addiction module RelE/StbE family toxin